ncbi:hypothetical protein NMY22_g17458 [Coprinellus aureogranulatus]|nr:hypothetical protein NMY22_g17458 [Coprinellus aureogranulatus]
MLVRTLTHRESVSQFFLRPPSALIPAIQVISHTLFLPGLSAHSASGQGVDDEAGEEDEEEEDLENATREQQSSTVIETEDDIGDGTVGEWASRQTTQRGGEGEGRRSEEKREHGRGDESARGGDSLATTKRNASFTEEEKDPSRYKHVSEAPWNLSIASYQPEIQKHE